MKYYFLDNRIIMITSDGHVPDQYDFFKENLTDEQLSLISQGYIFQRNEDTGEDELVPPEGREEEQDKKLLDLKRREGENLILSKYPYYKQLNTLRLGPPEEIQAMGEYIDGIRNELRENEKDADFTLFYE